MARFIIIILTAAALAGCTSYTEKTSPCVCDWTPLNTAQQVAI